MLKNRIVYLVVLVILGLFRIAYTGYVAGMLLLMALILPIFSWLISLPGALYTQISLSAPDQVTRGQEASISLSIRQSRLFSTGAVRGKLRTTSVVTGTSQKVRLKNAKDGFPLDTSHCCQYTCSLKGLRLLDLMGLLPMPVRNAKDITVTVVPFPVEPPEHPDWSNSSTLVAKPFSGGANPYDLREYHTGDTLRSIHWKKSAALDKTVVRDTLEPLERIASIWIDWPEDPAGRDYALDQLSWCLIYLKQNNAGLLLRWLDRNGDQQQIFGPQGDLDNILPQMLAQKAGQCCPASLLQPYEILLSASLGGEVPA
jgi:uncharacterized protein (DUF58 family)